MCAAVEQKAEISLRPTSTKAADPRADAWKRSIAATPVRPRLFVELVLGCRNPCAFKCRATQRPLVIKGRSLIKLAWAIWKTCPDPIDIVLYGLGDAGEFPWLQTIPLGDKAFQAACCTSLSVNTPPEVLHMVQQHFVSRIWAPVSTIDDVESALAHRDFFFGVTIPGTRGVPIAEIVQRCVGNFDTIVVRSNACDEPDHLSAEEFGRLNLPLTVRPRTRCSFGPLLTQVTRWEEHYVGGELVLCFDSFADRRAHVEFRIGDDGRWTPTSDGQWIIDAATLANNCDWRHIQHRWEATHVR